MAKILVVGCGNIGYRVALAMHDAGHRITALKRQAPATPAPFPLFLADIRDESSLQGLPAQFDMVLFIVSAGSRQVDAYRALYQTGLQNLLDHFAGAGAKPKWLMVSSSSVYGQNHGEWVDEASETRPLTATGQCLVNAEQLLWADDENHCVVRFSGIYGPGRDGLLRRAASGEAIQQQPLLYTNRIHSDDCVSVLLFLINRHLSGDSLQPCYLASDNEPAPLWDVMHWIAEQYDFPMPEAANMAGATGQNKRCGNARLTAEGYRFLFSSYRDGYLKPPHETAVQKLVKSS